MEIALPHRLRKTHIAIVPGRKPLSAVFLQMDPYSRRFAATGPRSDFLNARFTHRFLEKIERAHKVETTLGGYFEDRASLWRCSYLDEHPGAAYHLAIDVNLPAHTPLTVKHPSTVERITHDPDQQGGWGTVVAFKLHKPIGEITHYLYAHLSKDVRVMPGQTVLPGRVIGHLGREHENGGWYEHLHVQAFSATAWKRTQGDISLIDGYGRNDAVMRADFPNPLPLITAPGLRYRR